MVSDYYGPDQDDPYLDVDDVPPDDLAGPTYLERLRAALVDTAGLDDIPEPEPLIPGVLYRDSLAWLYGKPGCGKSFVAIDLSASVGTGTSWQGYGPVRPGEVLYLVAEGVGGIKRRVRAWEDAAGTKMTGVQFLPVAVQAAQAGNWKAFVELAAELRPALVVIDTQARVTTGMEENSAKEMGLFVERVEQLRRATGACCLVVHHTGRAGDHMRGSIAMDGAATTTVSVEKDEDTLTLKCTKQKDTEPFGDIKLRMVTRGNSVVLTPGGPGAGPVVPGWARVWWETFGAEPTSPTRAVKASVVPESTFHRNVRGLVEAGIFVKSQSGNSVKYAHTGKGVQTAPESPTTGDSHTPTPRGVGVSGSDSQAPMRLPRESESHTDSGESATHGQAGLRLIQGEL